MNISATADGSLLSPTGGVNTMYLLNQKFTNKYIYIYIYIYIYEKRLRKSVYDLQAQLTTSLETHCGQQHGMTRPTLHTDANNAAVKQHCTRSVVVVVSMSFITSHLWLKPFALCVIPYSSHPCAHAHCCLERFSSSLVPLLPALVSSSSFSSWRTVTAMMMNTLCKIRQRATFVTLGTHYLPDTGL